MDIEKLIEKGLVKKQWNTYNFMKDGQLVKIKANDKKAVSELLKMDIGKLSTFDAPIPNQNENHAALTPNDEATEESAHAQNQATQNEQKLIEEALSSIMDINISDYKKDALMVYINGINSVRYEHPLVKQCRVFPIWMLKSEMMSSSDKNNVLSISVASKSRHKILIDHYNIKTVRDDTSGEDYFSIGQNVLCFCKREQYFEAKEIIRLKNGIISREKTMNVRQEFANSQANETDVDKLARSFKNKNSLDRSDFSKTVVRSDGSIETEINPAWEQLDKAESLDDLMQEAAYLDANVKTGIEDEV